MILVGVAAFAFTISVLWYLLRRANDHTAPLEILDAPLNARVEVSGTVAGIPSPQVAPLSGETCAWYEVVVSRLWRERVSYRELFRKRRFTDFLIVDASGVAMIKADRVLVRSVTQQLYHSDLSYAPTPRMLELLQSEGHSCMDYDGACETMIYGERTLTQGERVHVRGFTRFPTPEEIARFEAAGLPEPWIVLTCGSPWRRLIIRVVQLQVPA